jgi:predicted  nucleic acid-binding Zn-ribbon protein
MALIETTRLLCHCTHTTTFNAPGHTWLLPKWGELMAQNWNKLRKNLRGIGQVLNTSKNANWENFESLDKELSAISNKIVVLDTRIGVNPTASSMVSVWEAVEDLMGDEKQVGIKLSSFEKRQVGIENATKGMSNNRLSDQHDFDFLLQNFNSLTDNYMENIGKLLNLENNKRSQEIREAVGPANSRERNFGTQESELESACNLLESKIQKLQEDRILFVVA